MPKKPRPGSALTSDERLLALLGDAVDQIESMQATAPTPALEAVANTIRYVCAEARRQGPDLDEIPF